jgi:hypothetical protein
VCLSGFVYDCLGSSFKVFRVHCGALLHNHNSCILEEESEPRQRTSVHFRNCFPKTCRCKLSHIEMAAQRCEVVETDEAGNVTATYVQTAGSKEILGRVDVMKPQDTKALWQKTLDIFLPSGYPHSVTDDYLE